MNLAQEKEIRTQQYVLLVYFLRSLGLKSCTKIAPLYWKQYVYILMDRIHDEFPGDEFPGDEL